MKKHIFFILLINISMLTFAQDLFTGAGSSVFMKADGSLNVNGLILGPTIDYTVNPDPNLDASIGRTPQDQSGGENIVNRSFTIDPGLNEFKGRLVFKYDDVDVDNIDESALTLRIFDAVSNTWKEFNGVIDANSNNISFTFTEPIRIATVTAASNNVVLGNKTPELDFDIKVYPNPI